MLLDVDMLLIGQSFALEMAWKQGLLGHSVGFIAAVFCLLLLHIAGVLAKTNESDALALHQLRKSLLPTTSPAKVAYTWRLTTDICGFATCGATGCRSQVLDNMTAEGATKLPRCNWSGVCCVDQKVTGLSLSTPASVFVSTNGGLPEALGWMHNLQVLQMSNQRSANSDLKQPQTQVLNGACNWSHHCLLPQIMFKHVLNTYTDKTVTYMHTRQLTAAFLSNCETCLKSLLL